MCAVIVPPTVALDPTETLPWNDAEPVVEMSAFERDRLQAEGSYDSPQPPPFAADFPARMPPFVDRLPFCVRLIIRTLLLLLLLLLPAFQA